MSRPIEYCDECGEPTGKAGIGEDSLYTNAAGPFCEECWDRYSCSTCDGEGLKELCVDKQGRPDYLYGSPTGQMVDCQYCNGTGWKGPA